MNPTQISCLILTVVFIFGGMIRADAITTKRTPATTAAVDAAAAGPHAVAVLTDVWTDPARAGRAVPVKIYYPSDSAIAAPVVVVSHGLGGSREGYAYLGRHLASYGYVAVHLTHIGSDTNALSAAIAQAAGVQAALKLIAAQPANIINRPKDVSFAISRLLELNQADGPLQGRIDPERIGVAGHSFGAYTVMAVAGEHFFLKSGQEVTFGDPRVKAAVVMSPPANKLEPRQFAPITIPLLLMTGTLDQSPVGTGGGPDDRRKIFDMLAGCDRYLLVFTGGDHMVFGSEGRVLGFAHLPGTEGDASKDASFQAFVKKSSRQFFDAYLQGDNAAKRWLAADNGAPAELGENGTWSVKAKGR